MLINAYIIIHDDSILYYSSNIVLKQHAVVGRWELYQYGYTFECNTSYLCIDHEQHNSQLISQHDHHTFYSQLVINIAILMLVTFEYFC